MLGYLPGFGLPPLDEGVKVRKGPGLCMHNPLAWDLKLFLIAPGFTSNDGLWPVEEVMVPMLPVLKRTAVFFSESRNNLLIKVEETGRLCCLLCSETYFVHLSLFMGGKKWSFESREF